MHVQEIIGLFYSLWLVEKHVDDKVATFRVIEEDKQTPVN